MNNYLKRTARQLLLLRRLTDAKDRLIDSIAGINPGVFSNERVVGNWTIKDIIGHIVTWNQEFRKDIKLILRSVHPGYRRLISPNNEFNQWNQYWISRKRNWTWQRIWDDYCRDYKETVQLIEKLGSKDFRKRGVTPWKRSAIKKPAVPNITDMDSIETLITFHWRHSNEHVRIIEKWRRRRMQERK
jgi:hypothetical protein